MKHDEMQEYVWKKLGPRKWLVGKREVNLLTRLTIENWQSNYYTAAASDNERQIVAVGTLVAVKRMHAAVGGYGEREYGMIWTLLLSAIASVPSSRWCSSGGSSDGLTGSCFLVWQQELCQ
jgi:hypothetical protein